MSNKKIFVISASIAAIVFGLIYMQYERPATIYKDEINKHIAIKEAM